ncbi:MAG: tetratricopeptide repeat protein [Nitrospirae bacterium]|nr:tetratricopeptide repeat protein [Nitrospirota bacterium]
MKILLNNKSSTLAVFIVSFTTIMVYLPALQNEFVNFDDYDYVTQNQYIRIIDANFFSWAVTKFYFSSWHPITWLSHAVDYRIWGLNPFGHHLTSILLHGINTYLVSLLCINLLNFRNSTLTASSEIQKGWILSDRGIIVAGCITGLLFGIHPLHVESVAWVSERKDLLCAFFYLLSLICYSAYAREALIDKDRNWLTDKRYLLSLLFFVCALFSKPMAVTLPVILLLLDWYPFERYSFSGIKALVYEKIPFVFISLNMAFTTVLAQMSGNAIKSIESFPIAPRIMVGFDAVITYMKMMILPVNLINLYSFPENVSFSSLPYLISFIFIVLITVVFLLVAKRYKGLLAAWTYYLAMLFPVLGFLKVGNQAIADRYTYLPSVSFFLLIGVGIALIYERVIKTGKEVLIFKASFIVFVVAVNLVLVFLTVKQIGVWHDSTTLWANAIKNSSPERNDYYKRSGVMHIGLAMAYFQKGMQDKYMIEIKTALAIEPRNTDARIMLGDLYAAAKRLDEAIIQFKTAITDGPENPGLPLTYVKLGLALQRSGRTTEARDALRKSEELIKKYE